MSDDLLQSVLLIFIVTKVCVAMLDNGADHP